MSPVRQTLSAPAEERSTGAGGAGYVVQKWRPQRGHTQN